MTESAVGTPKSRADNPWEGAWFVACIGIVAAAAAFLAADFVPLARYFPLWVAIGCILLVLTDLAVRLKQSRRNHAAYSTRATAVHGVPGADLDSEEPIAVHDAYGVGRYAIWLLGYLLAIWLLSLVVASGLFVAAFLRVEAKVRWWPALLSGFIVVVFIAYGGEVFNMRWPGSLLEPLGFVGS